MKAVILGICPEVTLVDITHEIPPHDLLTATLELAASYKYFPAGTVRLVVVDPGVGSSRRGIAADTGDYRFVGPDNGVLSLALRESPPQAVVELTNAKYARPSISRTFEGRDRFAPAAAWLATGLSVSALGTAIDRYEHLLVQEPVIRNRALHGTVVRIDRFGNVITNVTRPVLERVQQACGGPVTILIGDAVIPRVVDTYADARAGELCALFGSTGHLETAAHGGSAAYRL